MAQNFNITPHRKRILTMQTSKPLLTCSFIRPLRCFLVQIQKVRRATLFCIDSHTKKVALSWLVTVCICIYMYVYNTVLQILLLCPEGLGELLHAGSFALRLSASQRTGNRALHRRRLYPLYVCSLALLGESSSFIALGLARSFK